MGGGDLNSKKSWHPNTIKNQERVWKAEQAAANEQKRIVELQRERAQERDRAELNELAKQRAGGQDDDRLHWMYNKPDKKGQQEDYLLGRAIEKNYDKSDQEPAIPAVARRVVGSSMMDVGGDTQVDLIRKVREDPLILIKERERAARAALLNNPLHRRKITELLKKDQEQQKEMKSKKKSKGNDLDSKLAEKLNALGGKQGVDLAALLASEDSSDSSSEDAKPKKKKKKKEKKSKNKKKKARSDSESRTPERSHSKKSSKKQKEESDREQDSRKQAHNSRYSSSRYQDSGDRRDNRISSSNKRGYPRDSSFDKSRNYSGQDRRRGVSPESRRSRGTHDRSEGGGSDRGGKGLSSGEAAARLAAMAAAGAQREEDRARRVAQQRAGAENEAAGARGRSRAELHARTLPDSLEARLHSNRHYIQRGHRHMDTNFARR